MNISLDTELYSHRGWRILNNYPLDHVGVGIDVDVISKVVVTEDLAQLNVVDISEPTN